MAHIYGSAELDQDATALIDQARQASSRREALWIVTSAPLAVVMRCGDLLSVPDVDFLNEAGLAVEVLDRLRAGAL